MLVIERFKNKAQFAIKLIGSSGDKFVDQVVKAICFHHEVSAPQFLGKRVNYVWKVFRLRQPGSCKRPHLLRDNL